MVFLLLTIAAIGMVVGTRASWSVSAVCFVAAAVVWVVREEGKKHALLEVAREIAEKKAKLAAIENEIRHHRSTLELKYSQLVHRGAYGELIQDKWQKEIDYFLSNVLKISDTGGAGLDSNGLPSNLRSFAKEKIVELSQNFPDSRTGNVPSDPIEFEMYCKSILESVGFECSLTPATGDNGCDINATKTAVSYVIQCKLYSNPVGNKAIQEVYAAKNFYRANVAAVVTTAGYTRQARQLASSLNVLLLDISELESLENFSQA